MGKEVYRVEANRCNSSPFFFIYGSDDGIRFDGKTGASFAKFHCTPTCYMAGPQSLFPFTFLVLSTAATASRVAASTSLREARTHTLLGALLFALSSNV